MILLRNTRNKMRQYKSTIILCILLVLSTNTFSQYFPLQELLNMKLNKDLHSLDLYEVETSYNEKLNFFENLKNSHPEDYKGLNCLLGLNNSYRTDKKFIPEFFKITDINNDNIDEYILQESYEGIFNCGYTYNDDKLVEFIGDIPFKEFLIKNPEEIWLQTKYSYLQWDRSIELLRMYTEFFCLNLNKFETEFKFIYYESMQVPRNNTNQSNLSLEYPSSTIKPKPIIISKPTNFYSTCETIRYQVNMGIINKKSYGWVLADSLDAYFVIMDIPTKYIDDSLGCEKITAKDRGYLACWLPKDKVEFLDQNTKNGLYRDPKTNEYLRFCSTKEGDIINYFSSQSFEQNLILESNLGNTFIVKFYYSNDKYKLNFTENNRSIICINPDGSKQRFLKIKNANNLSKFTEYLKN